MQAQKEQAHRQFLMNQQFENAKMMEEANRWKNEFQMDKNFNEASVSKEDEQKSIMNSTDQMLDVMLNDTDPRFQNSQFLHFLKRIRSKEVIIEGKEIREVGLNQAMMEKAWGQGEKQYENSQKTMKERMRQAQQLRAQESIKNNLSLEEHWAHKL